MGQSSGLLASVKTLCGTLLGIAHTRLELLATELEEERIRLTQMVLHGVLALFFFCMGVLLLTLLVVAAFWDSHRLAAIAAVSAVYLGIALLLAGSVNSKAKRKPRLFSASLAELGKDRAQLSTEE